MPGLSVVKQERQNKIFFQAVELSKKQEGGVIHHWEKYRGKFCWIWLFFSCCKHNLYFKMLVDRGVEREGG